MSFMIKHILIALFLTLSSIFSYGQAQFSASSGIIDDNLDLLFKTGFVFDNYVKVGFSTELKKSEYYERYSVDVGFMIEEIEAVQIIPTLEFGATSIPEGNYVKSFWGFGANIEGNYYMTDNLGLSMNLNASMIPKKEIESNRDNFKIGLFLGLIYKLNNN